MPFDLESLWDAALMPHRGRAMDWDKTKYTDDIELMMQKWVI